MNFSSLSALALAFINAAVKNKQDLVKVDHQRWIPRAVAACADREVGMVSLNKGRKSHSIHA